MTTCHLTRLVRKKDLRLSRIDRESADTPHRSDVCALAHSLSAAPEFATRPSESPRAAARHTAINGTPLPLGISLSRLSSLERLEQPEEARRLADVRELDAEGLHLYEEVLHIDDLVPDQ